MSNYHDEPCTFNKSERHGLIVCDQGQHQAMFCTVCGTSLPTYLDTCYPCQEAESRVPHLSESIDALRRSLVMAERKKA